MSTAFPAISLRQFDLTLNENRALFESTITRRRQVVTLAGGTADRWEGIAETRPLDATNARTMMAFLATVGLYGPFDIRDPTYSGAQSGVASALVQGGTQTGTSLIVDGVTPSTLILRAGEYFQVGTEYKLVTANATSNGGGVLTINFKPALRVSPADNATVTFNTPRLFLLLTSMPANAPSLSRQRVFTFSFEEAI